MSYHGMDPLKHFEFMFRATVEPTGRVRTELRDIMPVMYSDPMPIDIQTEIEREISIKMGERDYQNFMQSYGKYLELTYNLEKDPVAKDMFSKLMMYIYLKR